jgi:sulfur carrier protein ThiS
VPRKTGERADTLALADALKDVRVGYHAYAIDTNGRIVDLSAWLDPHSEEYYRPEGLTPENLRTLTGLAQHDHAYIRQAIYSHFLTDGGALPGPDTEEGKRLQALLDALADVPRLGLDEWDNMWALAARRP